MLRWNDAVLDRKIDTAIGWKFYPEQHLVKDHENLVKIEIIVIIAKLGKWT